MEYKGRLIRACTQTSTAGRFIFFLFACFFLVGLGGPGCGGSSEAYLTVPVTEIEPGAEQLLHHPSDGAEVAVNPPGFTWTDFPAADCYRFLLFPADSEVLRLVQDSLSSTVAVLESPLQAGSYSWFVLYEDSEGEVLGRSRRRSFSVKPDLPLLPMPDIAQLSKSLKGRRPRLFLTRERLERIRRAAAEGRIGLWDRFQSLASKALEEPLYPEPEGYRGGKWDVTEWRRIYTPAKRGTAHMTRLALLYKITGRSAYRKRAREWLLHLADWDPRGIASHDLPQPDGTEGNDEASMPMLERMSIVYDWIGEHLSESEKELLRESMRERGNQVLALLKKQDFLSKPFSNHEGRVLAFLGLAGLSFLGEIPEAERWLDYVLRCYLTSYPVWGGDDGGWAQGLTYWSSYVLWLSEFADALRTVTEVDLYRRPFFRNTGYFPVHFHPPYAPRGAFGDGGERGPSLGEKLLIQKFAVAFRDPILLWHSRGIEDRLTSIPNDPRRGWNEWLMEDVHDVLDSVPPDLRPQPPSALPSSKWLENIGWVAAHSHLGDQENDVWMLFKSSRFGSYSHSHGDQNSFQLNAYGEALLIDSGYYPWYGSPHHTLWTRQTHAHNAILINGRGQPAYSMAARGRVEYFRRQGEVTVVRADAAPAYNVPPRPRTAELWQETFGRPYPSMDPRAGTVRRTLAFVASRSQPWLVVHDFVQTEQPAIVQYLLHTLERMSVDKTKGKISIESGQAMLDLYLVSNQDLAFTQKDGFPVPPEEAYEDAPEQFHLTAETHEKADQLKFLAVCVPYRRGQTPPEVQKKTAPGSVIFWIGDDRVTAWWGEGETGPILAGAGPLRLLIETGGEGRKTQVTCE